MARDIFIIPNRGSTTSGQYPEIQFNGASASTISLKVDDDGSVKYTGDNGTLFNITDSKEGLLHSVSDISGLPILQVWSDDRVIMGRWDKNALVVNSDKVGVGLTAPSVKLHVYGTSSGIFRLQDGSQASGYIMVSDTNGVATWTASSNVFTQTGNGGTVSGTTNYVAKFTATSTVGNSQIFDNSSFVGINATTQTGNSERFAVNGVSVFKDTIFVGGAGDDGYISYSPGSHMGVVALGNRNLRLETSSGTGDIILKTNGSDRAFIDENGTFTINSASASWQTWGSVFGGQPNFKIKTDTTGYLEIGQNRLILQNGSVDIFLGAKGGSRDVGLLATYNNNDIAIDTNNTERLRITNSGDVGIGLTAPSYKLQVIGTVSTTGFKMTNGATDGYYLKSDSNGNATWATLVVSGNGVTASGTTNTIAKFTNTNVLGDSLITDNGTTVTIAGNLTVTGTSSTVNTVNLTVQDPIILLSSTQSGSPILDSGIMVRRGTGATQAMIWDESADEFVFISTNDGDGVIGNVSISSYSPLKSGNYIIIGSGTTSASSGLTVRDSNSSELFKVRNDGRVYIKGSMEVGFGNDPNNSGLNVALGVNALASYIGAFGSGADIAVGDSALRFTTTGQYNVALGHQSLYNNVSGSYNIAINKSLFGNITGTYNIGIGPGVLNANTASSYNIGIGDNALQALTSGSNNLAIGGYASLYSLTSGSNNIALGYFAGVYMSSGSANTIVGHSSLSSNPFSGSNNTIFGGSNLTTLVTGDANTVIGRNIQSWTTSLSNHILIGDGSGNIRIMSDSSGNIGIGLTGPSAKLHVSGSSIITGNLTVDTDTLFVDSSSNRVGIGTTSPAAKLHSLSSTSGELVGYFRNTGSATNSYTRVQLDSQDGNIGLVLGCYGSNYTLNSSMTNTGAISSYSSNLSLMITSNLYANLGDIRFASYTENTNIYTEFGRFNKAGQFAIGTTSPNASALVDLTSTTMGFLPPRLTSTQMYSITSPATGLHVYNTTSGILNYYNGSTWSSVSSTQVGNGVTASGTTNYISKFTGTNILGDSSIQDNGTTVSLSVGMTSSNDIEISDNTKGVILKSPNGTRWRITIDNTGALTSTSL